VVDAGRGEDSEAKGKGKGKGKGKEGEVEAIDMAEVSPEAPGRLGAAARKRLIWGDRLVDVPVSGLFGALAISLRTPKSKRSLYGTSTAPGTSRRSW
jgi:hypothetical protein